MSTGKIALVCLVVFLMAGIVAYLITAFYFRKKGKLGSREELFQYYRNAEQKEGNFMVLLWAGIWLALMIAGALVMYLGAGLFVK
ncbi:MAG: hypothetical protein J6Z35_03475 [Lachnospiraceae bacterium]|nr:hypothetical protein [Lachnospiraceae bacterium]